MTKLEIYTNTSPESYTFTFCLLYKILVHINTALDYTKKILYTTRQKIAYVCIIIFNYFLSYISKRAFLLYSAH